MLNSTIAEYFGISAGSFTGVALMIGVCTNLLPPHGALLAFPVAIGVGAGVYQYRKLEREDAVWVKEIGKKMDIIIADEICKRLK